jgi:transcriptional regulator with XRE-family HTH domain
MVELDPLVRRRREEFGRRLRILRRRANLTQEALANAAGIDRSFYVELEASKHSISLDRVYDIADALGVNIGELFGE